MQDGKVVTARSAILDNPGQRVDIAALVATDAVRHGCRGTAPRRSAAWRVNGRPMPNKPPLPPPKMAKSDFGIAVVIQDRGGGRGPGEGWRMPWCRSGLPTATAE